MGLTLAQAQLYTTNKVQAGVLEEFVRMSPVLQRLPFSDINGNALQYLRESTRSSSAFMDPLDTWTENTGTVTQVTVALKILGGDADIDHFLKNVHSNYTDIEAELIAEKAKSMKFAFLDAFYYGDDSVNAKEFDGLHQIINTVGNAQQINQGSGSTGAPLSMANLDVLMDTIQDGPPDCLLTTKAIRRRVNRYIRDNGLWEQNRDEWGTMVQEYNGVPIYVDDSLVMTETIASADYSAKTGGATGSIFAVRFGPKDVFGIQNSGGISIKKLTDQLETKDASRWRLKWYVGMGLGRTISVARIDGITDAAAVS